MGKAISAEVREEEEWGVGRRGTSRWYGRRWARAEVNGGSEGRILQISSGEGRAKIGADWIRAYR